jgi:glutamyl-tRNA synthetase
MNTRTRIAPSPTGVDLHIGNAYTALINYIVAKQKKGTFIVRIEDTDRTRLVSGSEERILESLHWLGLDPNESPHTGGPFAPYRQSERLALYKKYAEQLVEAGYAYYCFCTPERLEAMRKDQEGHHQAPRYDGTCRKLKTQNSKLKAEQGEKHIVRLKVPKEGVTKFTDLIRGEISFKNALIDDQVLLKSDGFPTYHLGVVVDDHLMEISHIIRGEEWISSTPKHILLYSYFGWNPPVYAHMPLLRNPDKTKLSKRKNPVWISWYRKEGYLPQALLNYLATLAWAFPGGREVFNLEEMIHEFKLNDIQTTAPIFNIDKLRWMNGEYIRKTEILKFKTQISNFFHKRYNPETIERVWPLVKDRIKTIVEFEMMADFFFMRPKKFERPVDRKLISIVKLSLSGCQWRHDAMEQALRTSADVSGIKAKDIFMELRIAVTGKTVGPPLLESLEILGKDETLTRLS